MKSHFTSLDCIHDPSKAREISNLNILWWTKTDSSCPISLSREEILSVRISQRHPWWKHFFEKNVVNRWTVLRKKSSLVYYFSLGLDMERSWLALLIWNLLPIWNHQIGFDANNLCLISNNTYPCCRSVDYPNIL